MLLIASLAWVDPDDASSSDLSAKFSKILFKSFLILSRSNLYHRIKLHVCNAQDFLDNILTTGKQRLFNTSRFPLISFDSIAETFFKVTSHLLSYTLMP